jgi:hypothetical protein
MSFCYSRFAATVLAVAALLVPTSASAQPVLSVSPTSLTLQGYAGTNLSNKTVSVTNAGSRALKWSVSAPTASWLSVSPTSGTNDAENKMKYCLPCCSAPVCCCSALSALVLSAAAEMRGAARLVLVAAAAAACALAQQPGKGLYWQLYNSSASTSQ